MTTTDSAASEASSSVAARPAFESADFHTGQVLTISAGHFVHDTYSAFLSPLLPLIIEKLSLSLTLAGSLSALMQIPALLNPFIGYLADKVSLRYFIILAPALTATLMSLLGIMPSYPALAGLLFLAGIAVAMFHAPAPAMIGRVSGRRVGLGMSYFMAAGELGRTVGPLLAVWAVSAWALEGLWQTAVLGWATSLVLYLRLRAVPARPPVSGGLRQVLPAARRVFLPLLAISVFRSFMLTSLSVYLPTFLNAQGVSLWRAGGALSIWELAGVVGALVSGPLSDRVGRKPVLIVAFTASAGFMLLFLNTGGWLVIPVLVVLGLALLSTQPVMMAIVQEQFPDHRAIANGIYMFMTFIILMLTTLAVGAVGDTLGLRAAFAGSAVIMLLTVPAVVWLPGKKLLS
jgi:FSR family fosmidomycin resistance protein-like MFS transporter